VGRAEAASGHQQRVQARGEQRPVRDAVYGAVAAARHVLPVRVATRTVILDGRAAQRDLVVKTTRPQHVVAGQLVIAHDATRLAHAD